MSEGLDAMDWTPPPPRTRLAAAVILVGGTPGEREVFWVRRGKGVSFGPGMYAFPGGKVDAADREVPVAGATGEEGAFRVAAIREAFEEVGVLLAKGAERLRPEELRSMRAALLEGAAFGQLLDAHGLTLEAERLVDAGCWMTPPFSPLRFDTRFFLARAPASCRATIEPGELAAGAWIRPAEALGAWERGEALLHPPTRHALSVLAGFPQEQAIHLLRHPPFMDEDHVVGRIEFQRGILMFPLRTQTLPPATHTNCFVVGTRELAVIDPGAVDPSEQERIAGELEALEAEGRKVKMVLLSHHHRDHVGGAVDLARRFGVPLWASAATAARIPGAEGVLEDGQVLELDGPLQMRLRCLLTEGHADGHLCFLDEGSGAVLAGDLVAEGSTIVIDPPEGRMDRYLDSLRRIRDLPARVLYPSHGFPIPHGVALLDRYLLHREQRMEAIRIFLQERQGVVSLADLVENVYSDTPRPLHPVAERSALASLFELQRRGHAAKVEGGWTAT